MGKNNKLGDENMTDKEISVVLTSINNRLELLPVTLRGQCRLKLDCMNDIDVVIKELKKREEKEEPTCN
jgi:hypothetical protein